MTDYSFVMDVTVRFRDIDAMGHVNNAVYATYLEQARAEYFAEVLDAALSDVSTVLATLELEFRRPIELGDDVTVAARVPELGRSSVPMEYEVRANGDIAAVGEAVQVAVDVKTGESRPLPEEWRESIREFEGL